MNVRGNLKRFLALVMAFAICFSIVPWSVLAEESTSYTRISSMDELTTGSYVLVASSGYAPGALDGSWVTAVDFTAHTGDTITDAQGAVWTVTVSGGTAMLTDSNGKSIAPKSGNTNGILEGSYSWAVTCEGGMFTFAGQGADTTVLASNVSSSNKFRAYKAATVAGSASSYPSTFALYKLDETSGEEPSEEPAEDPTEETTQPSEPTVTVSTIAEAKAMDSGTEGITVEGVVIRVDGRNVVVQDATGGINLYFDAAPSDIALGDVIRAAGKRGAYNGLEQLTGVSAFTKTGTAELPAREVTVADILADQDVGALESTRVLIKGATLGEIVTSANTALTQGEASVNVYKIPSLTDIVAGDTVDVYAVVSDFKGYQLRVNTAADVTKVVQEVPADPWADVDAKYDVYELVTAPSNGDVVVLYNPGNARALSSGDSGYYKAGVEAAVVGETYIASDSETIAWTVSIDGSGLYTFTQSNLMLGVEKSGNYINLKTNAGDYNFVVTAFTEGGDLYRVRSATVESSYGFAYLEWYASKGAFSAYATSEEKANETDFGFKFYKLVREGVAAEEPEVPTEPETPEEPAGTTATLVTDVTSLAAGDQIVIVASGSDAALGTNQKTNNRGEAAVTKSEDGTNVTFGEDTQVITLEAGLTEGTWAFHVGGYLYAASSEKNYLRTEDTLSANSSWTIEIADGIATVKAQGENTRNWLRYNSQSAIFSCYASGQADISIYKLGGNEEEEEAPVSIADGDYVIWAPAYNMALSSVYNGFYNTGVAVTMEGEKLSGYGETEIWTVKNNEDGTITISFGGQNLALADSYSSMTLGEKHDTWTLEDAGNGLWYVKNVGRETYIEWYADKSNWSSYYKISEGSEGLFALQFTPAEVEEAPAGIADGDYVIWAPAYNVTVANSFNGSNYQLGTPVTPVGDDLVGYGAIDIWTVTNNADGTISISQNGAYLGGTSGSLTIVGAEGDYAKWNVTFLDNGDCYLQNVGNSKYLEWYATYSDWTLYSFNESSADLYTLRFTPAELVYNTDSEVVNDIAQWSGAYTVEAAAQLEAYGDKYLSGDKLDSEAILTVVANGTQISPYYLPGDNGYMGGTGIGAVEGDYIQLAVNTAGWGDMTLAFRMRATKTAPGEFQLRYSTDGGVTWKNFNTGSYAYAFTQYTSDGQTAVSGSGDITDGVARTSLAATYYVSFSFDVPAGAENCGNLLIRMVPGSTLANGKEGPAGTTSTIRMDSVVLSGSPIVDDAVASYVTVTPDGSEDQAVGTELTMTAEEGATIYYRVSGGEWQVYDGSSKPTLETLPCDIEVYASVEGKADSAVLLYHYAAGTVAAVKMDPNGGGVYIAGESESLTLSTATEGATIYYMTSSDNEVWPETWTEYTEPLTLAKGFGKLYVKAYAVKEGYTDAKVTTRTFTERTTSSYQLYFGQLHSHTNISDGAGSVEEAFAYAYDANNLDFLAVTDHSNSFDNADAGVISEDGAAVSEEWALGHEMAEKYTDDTFVGLYGYEMTWSNGLGHMNTFNTPGWQSRTQSAYTSYGTALQNYYDALTTVSDSISMFNHPGTTFGDFSDFAHYTEAYDELITLIEVGNGEGAIGSSGYFPSYEYYTRALDKGWHVAPANNQDNHKGMWGNSNTGRTVVLADSLTAEGIYDALRNYRVYATEDHDLNIYYTLNGNTMGSILDLDTGDALTLVVTLSDYSDSAIGKVELIVNGGLTADSAYVEDNSETVTFTLSNEYSYYYIKVTEADGDIAVTAPVWTGEVESCGISSFETDAALPVQNQEMNLSLELYNNEASSLLIDSIVFTVGEEVIHTADLTSLSAVKPYSTGSYTFPYTHTGLGQTEIYVTVTGTLNGVTKVYQEKLDLTYVLADMVTRVVVDGTHYNDYVTGYYGGNMNNLTAIAAESQIEVNVVTDVITPEILADCDLLIVSAPARFSGTANAGAYVAKPFEDSFIELVADYVEAGGSVIVCGLADYQDKKAASDDLHAAAQLNKLLAAIGSTMRINDDEAYDEEKNGGQAYRLYPEIFNTDSQWCSGIVEGQTYSQYSGCTVNVGNGTWLVKGFDTTYSIDSDNDGLGGIAMGEAVFMAVEPTSYGGNIFAAGGVFVSDFEVKAELDNIWDLPYANRTIIENIMGAVRVELPLSTIAEVRAAEEGEVFRIRGYVTAGTENEYNTFFDAIYVQDETGGITVFPFAQSGVAIGTPIEIIGYVDSYQGDKEIQVMSYTILDADDHIYEPEKMSNADAMDYAANGGELIQVEGEVVEVITTGENGVAQFVVKDKNGDLAKVFIDGYILSGTTGENELAKIVKVGNTVSAVGLLYMHPEGDSDVSVAVLRVRNCDEVVLIAEKEPEPTRPGSGGNANTGDGSRIGLVIGIMGGSLVLVVVLLVLMLKKKGKK